MSFPIIALIVIATTYLTCKVLKILTLPKGERLKPILKLIGAFMFFIVVAALVAVIATSFKSCGGTRGDGKNTCRNCGRDKPLSASGFCSTCQKGFDEWQEKEYEKNNYVPK